MVKIIFPNVEKYLIENVWINLPLNHHNPLIYFSFFNLLFVFLPFLPLSFFLLIYSVVSLFSSPKDL